MTSLPNLSDLFDSYSRQARLYPALLVILPIFVLVGACFPSLLTAPGLSTLITVAAFCGVLYLFSDFVRALGKTLEPKLLAKWHGWPTTEALRWGGPLDTHTLQRYHCYLQKKLPSLTFPTEQEEAADPAAADKVYESATKWLKEQCRGAKFSLVEKENAQYGFRRNTLGAKPFGIFLCALCVLVGCATFFSRSGTQRFGIHDIVAKIAGTPLIDGAVGGAILALAWWLFVVNADWVRQAGRGYAAALLAYCDKDSKQSERKKKTGNSGKA